jgi:hypothetical protein
MKDFNQILEEYKNNVVETGEDGAAFKFMIRDRAMKKDIGFMWVIVSFGGGWDHVSVSLSENRCPRWDEMCLVKDMFFEPEETVVQYHPAKSQYVNNHPLCLHLWRSQKDDMPVPDKNLV